MKMKKLLSVALALALALCFAFPALAQEVAPLELNGKLVILHTNDVHGRAVGKADIIGYNRIAMVKQELQQLGASVLLLDAGDFSQGMPIVNIEQGKQAVAFMNATGYDAATLGNHEFDWGVDVLLQNLEAAEFTVLCAGVSDTVSGENKFTPNKIFVMPNGMKVGVFGLITPETMTKAHPDKVKGVTFAQGDALYAVAQAQADELKAAGCDLIVCLGHLGVDEGSEPNRSTDLLARVTGIDLFIDGHSHTVIDGGERIGDTLLTSTGCFGAYLGYVIADAEGKLTAGLYTGRDEEVETVVNAVDKAVTEQFSVAFAKTEVLLNGERAPGVRTEETNLGDFTADAMLWAAKRALGDDAADCAINNGGSIRASIAIGDVTMLDMKTVFPYGNTICVIKVTGAEILEAFTAATDCLPEASGGFPQVAGMEYTVDTSIANVELEQYEGSTYMKPDVTTGRVVISTIGGEPFDAEKLYNFVTSDYTAAGGDQFRAFVYANRTANTDTGVALEDAMVDYVKIALGGVIGEQYAQPQGRITIK